jgi:hypothetical protein
VLEVHDFGLHLVEEIGENPPHFRIFVGTVERRPFEVGASSPRTGSDTVPDFVVNPVGFDVGLET